MPRDVGKVQRKATCCTLAEGPLTSHQLLRNHCTLAEDLLSCHQLLSNHACGGDHSETTIVDLLVLRIRNPTETVVLGKSSKLLKKLKKTCFLGVEKKLMKS